MTLKQAGAEVSGDIVIAGGPNVSGPVRGTVSGDVFSFVYVNASGGADLAVKSNEMTGMTRGGNRLRLVRQ